MRPRQSLQRRSHRYPRIAALAVAIASLWSGTKAAVAQPDHAAAVVVYPYVLFDSANGTDTELRLSNDSDSPIDVYCVYENGTRSCATTGLACTNDEDCTVAGDTCQTDCQPSDFVFRLTPNQPVGWSAGNGLPTLPCDASGGPGVCGCPTPDCQNTGSIPPVSSDPFIGSLRCIAVDPNRVPVERNDLEGTATVASFRSGPGGRFDVASYTTVGLMALPGALDGDNELFFGQEYSSCPALAVVSSFFNGSLEPSAGQDVVEPGLVLLPCSADFDSMMKTTTAVHLSVFNEFGQRLGTGRRLDCQFAGPLSALHSQIFEAGLHGTLTGQLRITSVESGLIGLAVERHIDITDPSASSSAATNLHGFGMRETPDSLRLPLVP